MSFSLHNAYCLLQSKLGGAGRQRLVPGMAAPAPTPVVDPGMYWTNERTNECREWTNECREWASSSRSICHCWYHSFLSFPSPFPISLLIHRTHSVSFSYLLSSFLHQSLSSTPSSLFIFFSSVISSFFSFFLSHFPFHIYFEIILCFSALILSFVLPLFNLL